MLSVEQAISGILKKVEKCPQITIAKQLYMVPRSLRGRSNKARKVARIGTASNWKTRMRGFNLNTMSSRSIVDKPFPPGDLHINFLGV